MAKRTKQQNAEIFARRNQLAKERGFKSYRDQRKTFEKAGKSRTFRAALPPAQLPAGQVKLRTDKDSKLVKEWREAFYGPDRDDYSVNGPKARWFIDVLDEYTEEEWGDLYPNGVREMGLSVAA